MLMTHWAAPSTVAVINLPGHKGRLRAVTKTIKNAGWPKFNRFNGVMGSSLSSRDRIEKATLGCALFCSSGQLGAALAHLNVWQSFLRSNKNHIIIFEDDVRMKKGARVDFESMWPFVPADFDILLLGCVFACDQRRSFIERFLTLFTNHLPNSDPYSKNAPRMNDHVIVPLAVRGMQGYVISRSGAEKLVRHMLGRVKDHVDVAMTDTPEIVIYALAKPIAHQTVKLGISTVATSKSPIMLTYHLDNINLTRSITAGYVATCPLASFGELYHINALSIIWLLLGMLLAATIQRYKSVFVVILVSVLVLFSLDVFYRPLEPSTWVNIAITGALLMAPLFIMSR